MEDGMYSSEQEEIVAALCSELLEIDGRHGDALASCSVDQQTSALLDCEQECEQVGNALGLAGLAGLAAVCRLLRDNFRALASASDLVPAGTLRVAGTWAQELCSYLANFGSARERANHQLLEFLALPSWPSPLSDKTREKLSSQLSSSELIDDNDPIRLPTTVDAEMVSLEIPSDVRPDLLDGLLVELPDQVRSFEKSVNAYLDSRVLADLDTAQRMAHTIKGAANVVGIAGVANLMHYCEDLIESAAARKSKIPAEFGETLLAISDCAATATEFLCGVGPAPDNSIEVMEALLNVTRQLKGSAIVDPAPSDDLIDNLVEFELAGLDELDESSCLFEFGEDLEDLDNSDIDAERAVPVPAAASENGGAIPAIAAAKQAEPSSSERDDTHYLNVPEVTAQQLLRITGESQIANTQMMTRIGALQASIQLSDRYHKKIKRMAVELESLVQTQTLLNNAAPNYGEGDIDPLELERYSELHSFSHQLLELTTDSYEGLSHVAQQIAELTDLGYTQKQLNQDSQDLLLELRLVPVHTLASRFTRCVRQAARLTHKEALLKIEGGDMLMDSKVLNRIADPIMHMLRNAVDHGLEQDAAQREKHGKPVEGLITLSFAHNGETISIRCQDDGRGLDYKAIRDRALRTGLIEAEQEPDEAFLNQLILLPSFSTRSNVSQTSGRGIGLDAVQAEIKSLRGQLMVTSKPGHGSCFEISVPASILTAHALIVRNSGDRGSSFVSIVTHSIEQVVYVEKPYLQVDGYYLHEDERLPVFALNDLTDIHRVPDEHNSTLLIVRKPDGSRIAVGVPAIIASQELVVKPLGTFCYHPEGVIGATIIGDGAVSPVIDLQKLPGMNLSRVELASLRKQRMKIAEMQEDRAQVAARVLIVDDSLSVRRSLGQFVSDMGMLADTARDGFEAIKVLGEHQPTLILVDLEMPRMNGLELTAHLRANAATRHIPVVMVSSRSTEKHRQMAHAAGVDGYLNKPWSDEDLLSTIQHHLKNEVASL